MLSIEDLRKEWHPTKNGELLIDKLKRGSDVRIWWQCAKGHEWNSHYKLRATRGDGCPYCSGRYAIVGENDLATLNPSLAEEWNYSRNKELTPQQVKPFSAKKVWWICNEKHEWEAAIHPRSNPKNPVGCPYCAGKKTVKGVTDLKTTHPALAEEWDRAKNDKDVTEVSSGSDYKAWWLGTCGHSWQATVSNRIKGKRCRYCLNRAILVGFNDLGTTHPELIAEWDIQKNETLISQHVSGSSFSAHWVCKMKHHWQTHIYSRTGKVKAGCPVCASLQMASKAEVEIMHFIQNLNFETETANRVILKGKELDIYIPSLKIAIEYNGVYWHSEAAGKGSEYHYNKWRDCHEAGIQLIQIWEDEWNRDSEMIKNFLTTRLNEPLHNNSFSLSTKVVKIDEPEAEEFLTRNHIQGFSPGSHYLGRKNASDQSLISVMVLLIEKGMKRNTLRIVRYASRENLHDGLANMLSYASQTYKPECFVAVSDNCINDGHLYENNGFFLDKELPPEFMYVVGAKRKHLLDSSTLDSSGNQSLPIRTKVWDAGKIRWIKLLGTEV